LHEALWLDVSLANHDVSDNHIGFLELVVLLCLANCDIDFAPIFVSDSNLFACELLDRLDCAVDFVANALTIYAKDWWVMRD